MSREEDETITASAAAAAAIGGNDDDDDDDEGGAEGIVTISERIRNALECPICLLLIADPTCRCPNGHVTCYRCLVKLYTLGTSRRCPMCRSPMARGPLLWSTANALFEFMRWVRVTCSYRRYGCRSLVPVIAVAEHEAACPFMPNVQCQWPTCQWMGMYDHLFEHVSRVHPTYAVRSTSNKLTVNDAKDILFNRRRTYLVKTPYGLFWVLMSIETRNRIRTSVLMVPDNDQSEDLEPNAGPCGMVFRVSHGDDDGKYKNKSRIRRITWSPSPKYDKVTETYTMVRCRAGSLQISWYDRHPTGRRIHLSSTATEAIDSGSLTT